MAIPLQGGPSDPGSEECWVGAIHLAGPVLVRPARAVLLVGVRCLAGVAIDRPQRPVRLEELFYESWMVHTRSGNHWQPVGGARRSPHRVRTHASPTSPTGGRDQPLRGAGAGSWQYEADSRPTRSRRRQHHRMPDPDLHRLNVWARLRWPPHTVKCTWTIEFAHDCQVG